VELYLVNPSKQHLWQAQSSEPKYKSETKLKKKKRWCVNSEQQSKIKINSEWINCQHNNWSTYHNSLLGTTEGTEAPFEPYGDWIWPQYGT
jgi:hypothetical protein